MTKKLSQKVVNKSSTYNNKKLLNNHKTKSLSSSGNKVQNVQKVNNLPLKKRGIRLGINDLNIGQIMDTTKDVITTGAGLLAGNPSSLLGIPNTIMKVVDTVGSTVDALTKDNAPKVVVKQADIKELQNAKVVEELRKTTPIVNTHSIPTTFATDIDRPPLIQKEFIYKGFKGQTLIGNNIVTTPIEFHPTDATVFHKAYSQLINPVDYTIFGERVQTIASLYQKWRMKWINVRYINAINTTVTGNVYLTAKAGTTPTVGGVTRSDVSQRDVFKPVVCYNSTEIAFQGISDEFLWCSRISEPTEQIKFFANQMVEVYTDGNHKVSVPVPIGFLFVTFEIELLYPIEYNYSFTGNAERRLQGHWISNYINLNYDIHLKLLTLFISKWIQKLNELDIKSKDPNSELTRLENTLCTDVSPYFERPITEYKIQRTKELLREYNSAFATHAINTCLEEIMESMNQVIKDQLKSLNMKYYKWIIDYGLQHTFESVFLDSLRYRMSEKKKKFSLTVVLILLLENIASVIRLAVDRVQFEVLDFEDTLTKIDKASNTVMEQIHSRKQADKIKERVEKEKLLEENYNRFPIYIQSKTQEKPNEQHFGTGPFKK